MLPDARNDAADPPMTPDAPQGAADPKVLVRYGYDRVSHAYRGDTFELDARSGYAHWLRRLTRRLGPGARVLDLGCGNGVPVARELSARFAVTGVDLSPVQIERARSLVPGARFVCADMTAVEFEPASFDCVAAFYSFIKVPVSEQPDLFRRIARWLSPGGWLLAVLGKYAWTGTEDDWRGVKGATMYWSHADLSSSRRWLADAGLEIVEEGTQPEQGTPGFAVLLARRVAGASG
jgi:SAM-dependent methyltransferase